MSLSVNRLTEVTITGAAAQNLIVNVLYYGAESTASEFDPLQTLTLLLTNIRAQWRAAILPVLSNTYTVQQYLARELTGLAAPTLPTRPKRLVFGEFVKFSFEPADTGGLAGESLPTFVAATAAKETGLSGRQNRGSMRIGRLTEAQSIGNTVEPVSLTAIQAAVNSFNISYQAQTLPVIINYRLRVFQRTLFRGLAIGNQASRPFSNVVVSTPVSSVLGSQVSRKAERGIE